ncbi:hypothetical protein [Gordonibacter massiliensis (ex Traore et al. 2017)]|uniref:hypothetical protein n=1 Tax=Gordonibacter massiliensis (ex Traore et al. 2017) TaxID=1841863 RepID=UPI0021AF8FFF|nr:hypothetical protein [Gordonibacter massiliensis (ex Traore et al. 2017)]
MLLCVMLVVGLLWPVPLSFAASEEDAVVPKATEEAGASKAPVDDVDNVVVETPSSTPAPIEPEPEPVVPEAPAIPDYENAWSIGKDDTATVIAELWDDDTFVVDGSGDTLAFECAEDVPWLAAGVADDIKRVVFADAVEPASLAHWFEGCMNLEEVANVPAGAKDLTRLFFDCPKLVELPDDFAIADDTKVDELFGFKEAPAEPIETVYRGTDENVLAYNWDADARILVNPDAPASDPEDDPSAVDPDADVIEPDLAEDEQAPVASDETEDGSGDLGSDDPALGADIDAESTKDASTEPDDTANSADEEVDAQVNITIPSSVSMMLGQDDPNSATIPVMVANRSERAVAVTGARLKRADMDLPGGSWSLTTEGGATTFVSDARFTPLGLEVAFDRPVILAAGDTGTQLTWRGTFTDYGMKTLLNAVLAAGDAGFTYGSMIWIVSAA